MKRNVLLLALLLSISLSLFIVGGVIAGTFDFGDVPGSPPVGEVNFTAWLDKKVPSGGGPPEQVITEDNTNSGEGEDGGYTLISGIPRWLMQVENLDNSQDADQVSMILGGVGASSGPLWVDTFAWIEGGGSTYQGVASTLQADDHPCPDVTSLTISGDSRIITWRGRTGTSHVYKSTQESGCCDGTPNDASNGRYDYIASVYTSDGNGSYTDTCLDPKCWYIIIHADEDGNIDGCHSEETGPTGVTLASFIAYEKPGYVQLEWKTVSEVDLIMFNIYRSSSPDSIGNLLNQDPIQPDNPGTIMGSEYYYIDDSGIPGVPYYYWLELVENGGSPEHVLSGPVEMNYAVFLPTIMQ